MSSAPGEPRAVTLPYVFGLRSDVRLIVTHDGDRAKRRLLDQRFPDDESAEKGADDLARAITSGNWPVAQDEAGAG
jgi:hypothetical protein